MNAKQLTVLWVTIGIVVLLSLFPVRNLQGLGNKRGFLFKETVTFKWQDGKHKTHANILLGTLIAQMIPFLAIGTGLIITLKDKKK